MRPFKKGKSLLLSNSSLFDEKTFYPQFTKDMLACSEVIIESPYITTERMEIFHPLFKRLVDKGVRIYVITRRPEEHEYTYQYQAEQEISFFEQIGVQPLLCIGNHHRKLAILDRKILYEGSLNILSQKHSREIMRRIDDKQISLEMFEFLQFDKII